MLPKITVAAQLYTAYKFTRTPEGIEDTFRRISEDGYVSAQVSGFGPIEPERLRDIAEKYGVNICSTHSSFDRMQTDLDAMIAEHKMWGCKNMGIGAMPDKYRGSAEGLDAFIAIINPIARRLADEGMRLTYHNHNFEFVKYDGRTAMDRLIEDSDPALNFIIDTYWVQAGGASPVEYIRKVKGRMNVCHFKDMEPVWGENGIETRFAPVGKGNINFREALAACVDAGVEYVAIEQDDCYGECPFDCLKISRENTIKFAEGIALAR